MAIATTGPDEHVFDCALASVTIAALMHDPDAADLMRRITGRQMRRMRPRPGGASREIVKTLEIDNDSFDEVEIRLPRMLDGCGPTVVHHSSGASLHSGHILKIDRLDLPETMRIALMGRRIGDLIDLSESGFAKLADAPILDMFESDFKGSHTLVHLDVRTFRIRPGDLARYAELTANRKGTSQ